MMIMSIITDKYMFISKNNINIHALQQIKQVANKQVSTYPLIKPNSQMITFSTWAVVYYPTHQPSPSWLHHQDEWWFSCPVIF